MRNIGFLEGFFAAESQQTVRYNVEMLVAVGMSEGRLGWGPRYYECWRKGRRDIRGKGEYNVPANVEV